MACNITVDTGETSICESSGHEEQYCRSLHETSGWTGNAVARKETWTSNPGRYDWYERGRLRNGDDGELLNSASSPAGVFVFSVSTVDRKYTTLTLTSVHNIVPFLFFSSSSACPQTDTAQLYNTQFDSPCTLIWLEHASCQSCFQEQMQSYCHLVVSQMWNFISWRNMQCGCLSLSSMARRRGVRHETERHRTRDLFGL